MKLTQLFMTLYDEYRQLDCLRCNNQSIDLTERAQCSVCAGNMHFLAEMLRPVRPVPVRCDDKKRTVAPDFFQLVDDSLVATRTQTRAVRSPRDDTTFSRAAAIIFGARPLVISSAETADTYELMRDLFLSDYASVNGAVAEANQHDEDGLLDARDFSLYVFPKVLQPLEVVARFMIDHDQALAHVVLPMMDSKFLNAVNFVYGTSVAETGSGLLGSGLDFNSRAWSTYICDLDFVVDGQRFHYRIGKKCDVFFKAMLVKVVDDEAPPKYTDVVAAVRVVYTQEAVPDNDTSIVICEEEVPVIGDGSRESTIVGLLAGLQDCSEPTIVVLRHIYASVVYHCAVNVYTDAMPYLSVEPGGDIVAAIWKVDPIPLVVAGVSSDSGGCYKSLLCDATILDDHSEPWLTAAVLRKMINLPVSAFAESLSVKRFGKTGHHLAEHDGTMSGYSLFLYYAEAFQIFN